MLQLSVLFSQHQQLIFQNLSKTGMGPNQILKKPPLGLNEGKGSYLL